MLKYVFITLLLLHGFIHLIGFVSGFGLMQLNGFTGKTLFAVSNQSMRLMAMLWLSACVLFIITATGFAMNKQWWWAIGAFSIVLSQILIIIYWKDAKAGTIANIIILLPVIVGYANTSFYNKAKEESKKIISKAVTDNKIVTPEMLTGLPACVQNWLKESGVVGKPIVHSAYLKQQGLMCIKPGGKWMPAVAEQYFNIDEPAFVWTVKVNMMPGVVMTGRDKYEEGKGNMLIKLYSLFTFADGKGDAINQGTMLRYLGEICWFPSAALQPYIKWQEINSTSAQATMTYKGVSASAVFTFDAQGRLISTRAMRYMGIGKEASLEQWRIPVTEWKIFDGIRIPSKGNASWKLKAGDYDYYQWEITHIRYNITKVNPPVLLHTNGFAL